jgi:hypothetical protein
MKENRFLDKDLRKAMIKLRVLRRHRKGYTIHAPEGNAQAEEVC